MTMSKPLVAVFLTALLMGGCATRGPMHLYSAHAGSHPVEDHALESGPDDQLVGLLEPDAVVVGLGYEFNTDYIWLRLAPGDRLIAIKRGVRERWYDYTLPPEFRLPTDVSGDLAVRAFNRMVYVAMAEPGAVSRVSRYGDVREIIRPGDTGRRIGGLAWDQVNDRLLVLYADRAEVVAYTTEMEPIEAVRFEVEVRATTLAYDSNRQRYYVPLAAEGWLGEFDATGRLLNRLPFPRAGASIDAGQRSVVRMF